MENKKNLKAILLQNAIGDWTTFKPQIADKKKTRASLRGSIKLSDDELYASRMHFLEFFERYMSNLQKNAGMPLSARSISVDQMTYPEILIEWDQPVAQFKFFTGDEEPWQICVDAALANALINRSVGGDLISAVSKGLTEIEENILQVCIKDGLDIFSEHADEDSVLQFINYPSLYFDQTCDESSPFIVFDFEMGMGRGQKGTIIFIVPVKSVRKLIEEKKEGSGTAALSKLPQQIIDRLKVPVWAFLGNSYITAKELYELEDGDVVLLDTPVTSALQVKVGEHLQLFGQPGIKGNKISVSLLKNRSKKLERIKSEEDESAGSADEEVFETGTESEIVEDEPLIADEQTVNEEDIIHDESGDENIS